MPAKVLLDAVVLLARRRLSSASSGAGPLQPLRGRGEFVELAQVAIWTSTKHAAQQ